MRMTMRRRVSTKVAELAKNAIRGWQGPARTYEQGNGQDTLSIFREEFSGLKKTSGGEKFWSPWKDIYPCVP